MVLFRKQLSHVAKSKQFFASFLSQAISCFSKTMEIKTMWQIFVQFLFSYIDYFLNPYTKNSCSTIPLIPPTKQSVQSRMQKAESKNNNNIEAIIFKNARLANPIPSVYLLVRGHLSGILKRDLKFGYHFMSVTYYSPRCILLDPGTIPSVHYILPIIILYMYVYKKNSNGILKRKP